MASEQHDTVFPQQDMDDDDEDSHEDDEYDDELSEPSPPASSALAVTVAVPSSSISNGATTTVPIQSSAATTIVTPYSDPKPHRTEPIEEKKPPPPDDSRRLFQRLWTDEDEMELLQGFLDYTSQRGSSNQTDTALFYDQIKSKLQLDFNKSQLVEKIRRLKKKYRNVVNRISSGKEFSFKTAHDQATFEVSRKIWGNVTPIAATDDMIAVDDDEINLNPTPNPNPNHNFSSPVLKYEVIFGNSTEKKTRKRSRPSPAIKSVEKRELNLNDGAACSKDRNVTTATTTNAASDNCDSGNGNVAGLIEETVKSCLSPLLKELVAGAMRGPFGARGLSPVGLMNLGFGELVDEKWRKQQILELEVYSKRLELVQDQVKATMEELRSSGGGGGGV